MFMAEQSQILSTILSYERPKCLQDSLLYYPAIAYMT